MFNLPVSEFLDNYPFLKPIIADAPDNIHKFFPNAKIEYEIVEDPEALDSQTLVIFIYTDYSAEKTFELMEKLEDDWWLKTYSKGDCKIGIDFVFI
jgi:hypothetical protein